MLSSLYNLPFCCLSRAGLFELAKWGGPPLISVLATCVATLMRSAIITYPEWRVLCRMLEAARDRLSLATAFGRDFFTCFCQGPRLVAHLRGAAAGFASKRKLQGKAGLTTARDLLTACSPGFRIAGQTLEM